MTLTRTTRADVEAYALAQAGRSRDQLPVPWTASTVMDDCAAFCSHVLWGGKPGPILWVDNFKTAGDGSYAPGSSDLAPWDVLLFDWESNGVGNHVEFMVGDLGNGYVRTFGANGSDSREARYRTRPRHYVMGRFRPAWQAHPAPAPNPHTSTTTPVGELVDTIIIRIGPKKVPYFANAETMKCKEANETQVTFWKGRRMEEQKDAQSPAVLSGFELVKGRGARA